MNANTKKGLMYGFFALLGGSAIYFAYEFFKKPEMPVDQTLVKFGTENQPTDTANTSTGSVFSNMPTDFGSITAPNIMNDLQELLHGKNPL